MLAFFPPHVVHVLVFFFIGLKQDSLQHLIVLSNSDELPTEKLAACY